MSVGEVKDWHQPRNAECPHNSEPALDCTCKRPRNRKPFRVVRVNDRTVGHRTNPKLVCEIWPDGRLVIHEAKRRRRYESTMGSIYERLVWREAMLIAQASKKAKADKKAAARKGGKTHGRKS